MLTDVTALLLRPGALGTPQAVVLHRLQLAVSQLLAWLAQPWHCSAHWLARCLAHYLGPARLAGLPLVLLAPGSCSPQAPSWSVTADREGDDGGLQEQQRKVALGNFVE